MDSTFLRARREQHALTPHEVAARLGVHPTSVLRWERRERLPGPAHIHGLARSLALPPEHVAAFFDGARPSPEPPSTVRGTGLRAVRRRTGTPVAVVAAATGVPPATVYNWESGRVGVPRDRLPALAGLLGTDVADLVTRLRAPSAPPQAPTSGLRRLRRRTGLSQAQVADRVGVARHSVSVWERGTTPPLGAVRRLARVYGVPVAVVAAAVGLTPPALLDPRRWGPGDLPQVLTVLRAWSGLTRPEVAARVGCSAAAVRSWESGRGTPRAGSRRGLERLYGLPVDGLLTAVG